MRRNKLLNLLATNAKRGEFRAEGNTLFLYDVIVSSDAEAEWFGGVSPEAFARQLAAMEGEVHLRINSPGGDVFAARAMAQAMREHDGEIIAHVDGYAASAASLIAVTAARCIMAPGSFMMIHKAWTLALGNSDDLTATAKLLEKIDATLAETYAAKTGGEAADFATMMAAETWFSPAEAVEMGLADEQASSKVQASARWDLSAYGVAPASTPAAETAPEPDQHIIRNGPISADEHEALRRRLTARALAPTA